MHSAGSVQKVCSHQLLQMVSSEATAIKVVLEKRKITAAMPIHAKDLERTSASASLPSAAFAIAQCE